MLNREEAHNTLFREAFRRIQGTGSTQDWGVDEDARLYFDLSLGGGQHFDVGHPRPPQFTQPQG